MMRARRGAGVLGLLSVVLVGWTLTSAESPVADAAAKGEVDTVRELLRAGADVNAAQGDGMTALHHAAESNDLELTELLLYAGATVSPSTRLGGFTPLHSPVTSAARPSWRCSSGRAATPIG